MTTEKLNNGIKATKTILNLSRNAYKENKISLELAKEIQESLSTIIDVLEDAFADMIKLDALESMRK
ncbi:MAG: hypothetical protein J6S85_13240 [Methanobrevibacter sp.]|nr:hypothetical protein [Methanobrevibacter sp.]